MVFSTDSVIEEAIWNKCGGKDIRVGKLELILGPSLKGDLIFLLMGELHLSLNSVYQRIVKRNLSKKKTYQLRNLPVFLVTARLKDLNVKSFYETRFLISFNTWVTYLLLSNKVYEECLIHKQNKKKYSLCKGYCSTY